MNTSTIQVTNHYGASVVTCQRHKTNRVRGLLGTLTEEQSTLDCPSCVEEVDALINPWRVMQALVSPALSHTRFRPFSTVPGGGLVNVLHRDPTSPSGVIGVIGCDALQFDRMFANLREQGLVRSSASPLSPTELR